MDLKFVLLNFVIRDWLHNENLDIFLIIEQKAEDSNDGALWEIEEYSVN